MHFRVDRPLVGLLIDHQPFPSGLRQGPIIAGLQRADFERDTRDFRVQRADAIDQVIGRDELRVFARDEQNVAKALLLERARLAQDFLDGQRHTQNRIVARKAAIFAVVNAFVGEVKGCEQTNDLAEALLSEGLRAVAHRFEPLACRGRNQCREVRQPRTRRRQSFANIVRRGG